MSSQIWIRVRCGITVCNYLQIPNHGFKLLSFISFFIFIFYKCGYFLLIIQITVFFHHPILRNEMYTWILECIILALPIVIHAYTCYKNSIPLKHYINFLSMLLGICNKNGVLSNCPMLWHKFPFYICYKM